MIEHRCRLLCVFDGTPHFPATAGDCIPYSCSSVTGKTAAGVECSGEVMVRLMLLAQGDQACRRENFFVAEMKGRGEQKLVLK